MALSRPLMNFTKSFGSFRTFSTTARRFGGGEHATDGSSFKMWKMATYFFCIPVVIASTYINLGPNAEHGHRPEFVPYEYLRVRTKPFKDGYEVEETHQSVMELYGTVLVPRVSPGK